MSGYIGTQPVPQATQTRDSFTATSGQTSFATGGYTPNFLDIFLNGVKLSAADYTASNGSDVVLASGAATGDILEVVAFTTFNSASSSIDDNGNATALTIDSSENVLVGTTDSTPYNNNAGSTADNGIVLSEAGWLAASRYQGTVAFFNRTDNDGDIAVFRKDGTTVGSIGYNIGALTVDGGSSRSGFYFGDGAVLPRYNGSLVNGVNADLGATAQRFQDLYLSGGILLGGTVSANKLDDYEEGTFTPTNNGTVGVGVSIGKYTKVGEVVHFHIFFQWTSNTSMTKEFSGLPFTVKGASSPEDTYYTMCSTWNNQGVTYPSGTTTLQGFSVPNTTTVDYSCVGSNVASGNPTFASTGQLYMTGHYYTAS